MIYKYEGCSGLASIEIPNSVTSIGPSAFYDTAWLNSLEDGMIYINNIAYQYKGTIPENTSLKIKEGTVSINEWVFDGCSSLTSIEIPNSVTSIGRYAFQNCTGLTSIEIPSSVTYIGTDAFNGCSNLKRLTFFCKEVSEWFNYEYKSNIQQVFIGESVETIGYNAFNGFTSLTSIEIPTSVTSIGDWAFEDCSGLTSISIPNSVTSIKNGTFQGCTGLTSIDIPNTVTEIREQAIYGCTGLTSIYIPSSIVYIGNAAFGDCTNLAAVHISDLTSWCKISYPNSEFDSGWGGWGITLPSNNPLYYARHLFINGKEIKNLIIPEGVESINNQAFYGCEGLVSVTIPSSLSTIGKLAFKRCSNLTEICIPDVVLWLSMDFDATAFPNEHYLSINGEKIINLTIPEVINSIENSALYNCKGIETIKVEAKRPPTVADNFANTLYETCTLYVPEGSENAYYVADGWKNFKKIETFKEEQPEKVPQDVNGDGIVDTQDVLEIYKYIQEH